MSQQRKLSRHSSRQSSTGETASVCSAKSGKSNGSGDYNYSTISTASVNHHPSGKHPQPPIASGSKANGLTRAALGGSQDSSDSGNGTQTSILNVAEMLLHGVADNEILDNWLRNISCEEFVQNFINAGYDMPTISRITPQDLTAIGITEPSKRLKILSEIRKLNLQDGLPNFVPASLNHWLSLLRLDKLYYKSLCDQQIDTIEKLCQLTWEDFEELGIAKLGHQKRLQLAIERLKSLETETKNSSAKPISEPIYDTNPSQILLVASSENHSMNGPIINKQSSTSELSSTGSGSMHSVYSANSSHYQSNYAPSTVSDSHIQPSTMMNRVHSDTTGQKPFPQPIYGQASSSIYQQLMPQQQLHQQQMQYQQQYGQHKLPPQQQVNPPMPFSSVSSMPSMPTNINSNGVQNSQAMMNRQSMMNALANLPKHQQQILQQSSIYATLSRQPGRVKQPPPPVPIRTNSLKTNSLIDEAPEGRPLQNNYSNSQTQLNNFHHMTNTNNRNQMNSQTLLTKNKSFSGNAHMEASRARFLNRQSQQPQQHLLSQYLPHQMQQALSNQNHQQRINNTCSQNNLYGANNNVPNGNMLQGGLSHQHNNIFGQINSLTQQAKQLEMRMPNREDLDLNADTNSTKSLVLQPSASSSIISQNNNGANLNGTDSPGDSGSSNTLYNSASSGSNEHGLNLYNLSSPQRPGVNGSRPLVATASSSTLNDANHLPLDTSSKPVKGLPTTSSDCNATTGKDDEFPPPPSPLSLTDSEDHDIGPMNQDGNFLDIQHGLMTFKVGT